MEKTPIKRYSQAFKQQVVREYEKGVTIYRLRQKYGIGGYETIKGWIKKYGRSGYRNELVIIQGVEDQQEVKDMKKRIVDLEAALAQSMLDKLMLETTLTVASKSLGMDLKKNFAPK